MPHLRQRTLYSEPILITAWFKDETKMGIEGGTTQNTKKPQMPSLPEGELIKSRAYSLKTEV